MADLIRFNLHTLYCPELRIYHKGEESTKELIGKEQRKVWEFTKSHKLESINRLISYLESNYKEIYERDL